MPGSNILTIGVILSPQISKSGKKNSKIIDFCAVFVISILVLCFSLIYNTGMSTFKVENDKGHLFTLHEKGILMSFVLIEPVIILQFYFNEHLTLFKYIIY